MKVLFCGQSSYPLSNSATANRYRAIAEAMHDTGAEIVFVNRHGILHNKVSSELKGDFRCVCPSGRIRESSFLLRQLKRVLAAPREAVAILKLHKESKIDFINVYTQYFLDVVFYFLLSKLIGAKVVLHVVEVRTSFSNRSILFGMNDFLFERLASVFCSHFVAISSRTAEIGKAGAGDRRVLIVPPLCDFEMVSRCKPREIERGRYFLYCASLEYEDVAWFVIESYLKSGVTEVRMVLVLSGVLSDRIRKAVSDNPERISLYSGVSYEDLIALFKGSLALLIPLRDCEQDAARFPQKISEYLASGRAIVSTKVGEIPKFFVDGHNALIAESYDVNAFSERLRFAAKNVEVVNRISEEGLRLGRAKFDVKSYVDAFRGFLSV